MNAKIYIEGGGDSKELHVRCRQAFRQLIEKCGFSGRMPQLVACGGREATFDDFRTAHAHARAGAFIAILIDSEEPVAEVDQPWAHLARRDGWMRPHGADDDQVLLMTTCMETWIICDGQTLATFFGNCLQTTALPSLHDIESRSRGAVHDALVRATRACKAGYVKGTRSFEVVGRLNPATLRQHLPSFVRFERVLKEKL